MPVSIQLLTETAEKAGREVMRYYAEDDLTVTYKDDHSPLTCADMASHQIISDRLSKITPDLPILSEESKSVAYEERRLWETYWLIDPLDGTKEFIKRNGEFTINISLIENRNPLIGIVHAPASDVTYYALRGQGAFKKEKNRGAQPIHVSVYKGGPIRIVASRSHRGERLESFLKKVDAVYGSFNIIHQGSSLKFCLLAEGAADLYPRLAPTMEWDIAAAHCIVEEAGGVVVDLKGNPMIYNKQDLLNGDFIVSCSDKLLSSLLN